MRPGKKPHILAWGVIGLLLLAGQYLWSLSQRRGDAPASTAAALEGRGVDWYFLLRMPAITAQYESGIGTMKERYELWLDALGQAGFQPMLLSEVRARIESGAGVPPKTVVIAFEPAYRRTLEIISSILERNQWPALWLSNGPAMDRAQREFITYHTARQMIDSQWWDVGYSNADGSFEVRSRAHPTFLMGRGKPGPWSRLEGTFAVNHGAGTDGLNILTVNADWNAEELLNRLRVEQPPVGPTFLTQGLIHHREWGLACPASEMAQPQARFDLTSPLGRRGTRLYWLGTKAAPDFKLHIEAGSVIGELQVHLRADDAAAQELRLIYTESKVILREYPERTQAPLFVGDHPAGQGHPFTADVVMSGRRLEFSYNGGPTWSTEALENPGTKDSLVQLSILDKVRGIGRADSVALLFTPLPSARPR